MKTLILTILTMLIIAKCEGQFIKIKTNDGMPLVKTQVLNENKKLLKTTTANLINLNKLVKPNTLIYLFSTGYDTVKVITTGATDTLLISLKVKAQLLNAVLLSSSKKKQKYQDISVSILKVKPYLIENKNSTELTETINQIPSVNIIDNQASIRGGSGWSYGSGTRVMVSVDGLPAISGDANQIQWQFLDMQNIESIEVLKGASSVLYGSSALNGAINIQTKPATDSLTGSVNSYFGFYDKPSKDSLQWSNNTLLKYGINGFVSFKKKKTDYIFTTLNVFDDGYRMGDKSYRNRVGIHVKHHLNEKIDIGAKLNGMYTDGSTFLLWESGGYGYTALDSSFNKNLTSRLSFDPYLTLKGKKVDHKLLGRYFYLNNDIYQADTLSQQSNSSNFGYLEYRGYTDKWIENLQLSFGAVANSSKTNSPLFQGVQKANNFAGYLQAEKRIKKWFLSTGVRYETFVLNDRIESRPVFKAGATFTPSKFTIFRASYGEGYRFPSIGESFVKTSVGPVTIYPNEDLKAETAWNGEIGVKQGFRIKGLVGFLDVAAFYTKIDNMIEFTFAQWSSDNSFTNLLGLGFKSINTGTAVIKGIDASLVGSARLSKNKLKFLTGYTFNDARSATPNQIIAQDSQNADLSYISTSQDTLNNYLKYRSIHTFKADVQWERGEWSLGVSARYNSFIRNIDKAFVGFPINLFVPGIEEVRQQNNKGNLVFDIRLIKSWQKGYRTSFIVNNALNNIVMERPADLIAPRYFMLQLAKQF